MRRLLAVLLIAAACASRAVATPPSVDVCVYQATPAGIAASIAAAKDGKSVLLIEPTDRVGGLMTSGLSYSDFRTFESLTGAFHGFRKRVKGYYTATYGEDSPQVRDCFGGVFGEPKVNLRIFRQMLAEQPRITVLRRHELHDVATDKPVQGVRSITAIALRPTVSYGIGNGKTDANDPTITVHAKAYIDASYEGDLMAMAGEPFHVGRESRKQYGESLAGNRMGQADGQVQGYNFRFVMTQIKANQTDRIKPDGYDREDFVGILPLIKSGRVKRVFSSKHDGIYRAHLPLLPNGKADVNDTPHAPVRLSMPDINDEYPTGDRATRQAIFEQHVRYNVGLLYFLQSDPAVPEAIRKDADSWRFCKDEFADTGHLPPRLYIREARRLIGQHVFTQHDTDHASNDARAKLHRDAIAIGDYVHNCHGTGRLGPRFGGRNVGEMYKPCPPYQIPYGVIVPTRSRNLLVPVAVSASHVGFSALRLEPIWMNLGQAAGHAASLAIDRNTSMLHLPVDALQRRLHAEGAATIYVTDVPPEHELFAAVQWLGTRGGLHGLVAKADGGPGKHITGQYSKAYRGHAVNLDTPITQELLERWVALLPKSRQVDAQKRLVDVARKQGTRGEVMRLLAAVGNDEK